MRNTFDEQLSLLNVELIKMGALCEEALAAAMKALFDSDLSQVTLASEYEREIDQKERDIESLCMRLILQQQPVARDLRAISAALRMISDMERIGDQAEDIAEITKHIEKKGTIERVAHLKEMSVVAAKMVTQSVDSFVKGDVELARDVILKDDVVDADFNKIRDELIEVIISDKYEGKDCIDLLMAAKYLERIADHAVNIAEWVEYSLTGVHRKE